MQFLILLKRKNFWGRSMATSPNHSSVVSGSRRLKSKHYPLRISGSAIAGRGWEGQTDPWPPGHYAPVSTVQSLVLAHRPLYQSSLRPPAAGNESIHKLRHAMRVAHCAVWEYWRHVMHFVIPRCPGIPGMTFVHPWFPVMKKQVRECKP